MSRRFFTTGFVLGIAALAWGGDLYGQAAAQFEMEFTNAQLVPSHWVMRLNPDGSGQFDAQGGTPSEQDKGQIVVKEVHRPIQLSEDFASRVFAAARRRKLFAMACDSHLKVAFQGTKRLSYRGPEGSGSCEYNYSKDKEIQSLGEMILNVEVTLMHGARLEKLLQHDRLGLDKELEDLVTATHEGNALELGSIRETLTRVSEDEQVLERVRKKARLLLGMAGPAQAAVKQP